MVPEYMKTWPDAEATKNEYTVIAYSDRQDPEEHQYVPSGFVRQLFAIWVPGRVVTGAWGVKERPILQTGGNPSRSDWQFLDEEIAKDFASMLNFHRQLRQPAHSAPMGEALRRIRGPLITETSQ